MPEVSLVQWNKYVQSLPDAHFLQTGEWGELKSKFGWSATRLIVGQSGVQVLFRRLPLGLSIAYIPKAIPEQVQESDSESLQEDLDQACRRRRAILCKDEPDQWSEATDPEPMQFVRGATPSRTPPRNIQPRRTILVDIRPTEDEILARMKQKWRYNIRLAQKKGVTIRKWDDTQAFHSLALQTAVRDAFAVHSAAYYRAAYDLFHPMGGCELLVAEFDGQPLAALMVFARGRRAWYVYGASSNAERERMPNHLLQWHAMLWAKQRGCETYDLWGVPDEDEQQLEANFERRNDGLWGVYRFKRGFGGTLKRAAPAIDRVYNPLLYRLYLLRAGGAEVA